MMTLKSRTLTSTIAGTLLTGVTVTAWADSTDDLLKLLRDKSVISQSEFEQFNSTRDQEREKKLGELKVKFKDGLRIESADKSTSIGINGRIQFDYRNFSGSGNIRDVSSNTFNVRRAYLTIQGRLMDHYMWYLTLNAAGSSAVVDQAYLNIGWWEAANLRFGKFVMPISLQEQTSSLFLDFQERSMLSTLVPGKEVGAMIHGTPFKGTYYGLALSNGEGNTAGSTDESTTNDQPDVMGRGVVNLAKILNAEDAIYHVGAAFSVGRPSVANAIPGANQEARGYQWFRVAALQGRPERTRTALEGIIAKGPVKLQGEWINYNLDGKNLAGTSYSRDIESWYLSANWLLTGESYADSYQMTGGRLGRILPKNNFVHPDATAAGGWGAWELGLRYSTFDGSDFAASNAVGTGVLLTGAANKASSWTGQVKWIINPNLRWMLDYVQTDYEQRIASISSDGEQAATTRVQWDF